MNDGAAVNTLRLGMLVKEHKKSTAHVVKLVGVSLISALVAAFFFVGSLSSNDRAGRISLAIPGVLFLLPVLAGIYMLFRGRGATLSLHENGLAYARAGKKWTTTWDEIESYIQETACRITKKDGEVIEFGKNLQGAVEVAQRIQEETLNRMLPQARARILSGSSVQFKGWKPFEKVPLGSAVGNFALAFSGFTVDAEGIAPIDGGENRIAWKDVTDFGIGKETLGTGPRRTPVDVFYVADKNQSVRTRLGLLANAHLLLALCAEMTNLEDAQKG